MNHIYRAIESPGQVLRITGPVPVILITLETIENSTFYSVDFVFMEDLTT